MHWLGSKSNQLNKIEIRCYLLSKNLLLMDTIFDQSLPVVHIKLAEEKHRRIVVKGELVFEMQT